MALPTSFTVVRAAALRPHAGEQIGHDGDIAGFGQFVGHQTRPVGGAEDLMDDDHGRRLVLDLRIDDEGLHFAVAVLELNPLPVARRLFETLLGPVLGRRERRRQQQHAARDNVHRLIGVPPLPSACS